MLDTAKPVRPDSDRYAFEVEWAGPTATLIGLSVTYTLSTLSLLLSPTVRTLNEIFERDDPV